MGPHINSMCVCCPNNAPETILHRFIHCNRTRLAWEYGLTILNMTQGILPVYGTWPMLTWQQCLLASKLPHQLKHGWVIWSLLRGAILWIAWLDRNAKSFSNDDWSVQKTQVLIWEATLELGRTAWLRVTTLCQLHPLRSPKYIRDFDIAWLRTKFLGHRVNMHVYWYVARPLPGSFV
jgi:hypothetical protein